MFGRKTKKGKDCTIRTKSNVEASTEATKACSTKSSSNSKTKACK